MSFSNIIFRNTNVTVEEKLHDLVEQKFTSLEKYIGDETDLKCEVEFEKIASHNTGDIYRVEANLWLSGKMHRAEATKDTFENAIDEVKEELDRELNKDSSKRQTLMKKGGREIKEAMRSGGEI
ncbi:MAG: ribosome-associated translation inhibitor RaiA [Candidatus Nomurabacteria bacterium]|nr:ribosome-associated translation inhibitor RaiA [Candidatus Nomurabacteria bacterium]USN87987.1 MAG: ribosome-associated translation inhibitor RaiA [Candidatus Nomurabacteria bacterium]